MRKPIFAILLLAVTAFLGSVRPAFAVGEGQEDLDQATEAKLNADTIGDLGDVIRLAESALTKGLDEANTTFAKKLLSSTLVQRAQEVARHVMAARSADEFRERRQSALADLEKSLQIDPKQSEAYLLMAQLKLLPEGPGVKEVRENLDKAIELSADEPAVRAKALLLRANLQEASEKKLADFDEAVRLLPGDANIVRARGLALADLEKLEPALIDLNKALELDPDDGPTYEAKAIVLARLKKYDEALVALDKARQLSPRSVAPLLQQARIHAQQQKLDAALDDLTQAHAMEPNNLTILMVRASVYQEKGDKEKALADIDQVLKAKPNLPIALRSRALLLADDKRFDEAIAELEKLAVQEPKDALTLMQLAMLYSFQKQSAKAIEKYNALLALEPDNWQALRGRGDSYLNIGKHAEAIADYEKAVKLEPEDEGILNNFAWVLATSPDDKLRDGRRALEIAKKACEVTEFKAAHILSTLAAACAEVGDFEAAVKWSSKAVEIGDKEHDESLRKELESYKAKKPWRERLSETAPSEDK